MYDAIIVGARCAGAATALQLAGRGRRVLMVDRATLPSGRVPPAGNVVAPGVFYLRQWGVLDQLIAAGCPPVPSVIVHAGDARFEHVVDEPGDVDAMYVADHAVLDTLLASAAATAGAEVRLGVRVTELVWEAGRVAGIRGADADGAPLEERAAIVVGADGKTSFVARATRSRTYRARAAAQAGYYAFWAGTGHRSIEVFIAPRRQAIVFPTHHGQAWVVAVRPIDEWDAFKADAVHEYHRQIELFPELAEAMNGATRVSRYYGTADLGGFFRQASGPGWALVGDAGHTKDPGPGRGISDAFIQADLLAEAVDRSIATGAWADELDAYGRQRDELSTEIYDLTHDLAGHPPLDEAFALNARLIDAARRQQDWVVARASRMAALGS